MDEKAYFDELDDQVGKVLETPPCTEDWRDNFPWLTGYLGNPFAGIWFLAENPSLSRADQVAKRNQEEVTIESQWTESPGDKLFRKMLFKHGFKTGGEFTPGGWECYITDVIKQPAYVGQWLSKPVSVHKQVADMWSEVLCWELEHSRPRLVVVMGKKTQFLLDHVVREKGLKLPQTCSIAHYSYIGSRPDFKTHLGPMAPERIAAYDMQFTEIVKEFNQI